MNTWLVGALFFIAVAITMQVPFTLVYYFPDILPIFIYIVVVKPIQHYGPASIYAAAMIAALLFYWLKIKHQTTYGLIEVFIAMFTIATAINSLNNQGDKTAASLLQLFGGIYLSIRGLDNVEKGLKESKSQEVKEIGKRIFAQDVLGIHFLFLSIFFLSAIIAYNYNNWIPLMVAGTLITLFDVTITGRSTSRSTTAHQNEDDLKARIKRLEERFEASLTRSEAPPPIDNRPQPDQCK
jgi:hypothetical protein